MKKIISPHYVWIVLIIMTLVVVSCKGLKVPAKAEVEVSELKGNDLRNYNYLFSEAIKQKLLGNYGQAIVYFRQCLDINPNSDAAMFELGSIYSYARDYPQALQFARMAAIEDEENLWYQLQLASIYSVLGKNDSNILVLESIVEKNPEKLDIMFQLGSTYSNENLNEKAINVFNELEEKVGFQESVSVEKIEIFRKTKRTKQAEEEVKRLIEKNPDNVEYKVLLAELFYEQGENEKAKNKYDELIRIYKENDRVKISMIQYHRQNENYNEMLDMIDSVLILENSRMEIKFNLVVALITDQDLLNEIKEPLEQSLKKFQKTYAEDIRIFALIGDFYVKTNQHELASQQFKKYIEFDSSNYLVWEQLLFLLNVLDEPDELYEVSNRALKRFPESPIIYFFKAIACTEIEKNDEAVKVLEKGMYFIENNRELRLQFYSLLGEAYKNLKQYEDSDKAFEEALVVDPGNLLVLNNYSYYLSLRGVKLKKALQMSKICIEREPRNSTYLDTYGWILFNMKKYKSSEKYLKRAIENEGDPSIEILDHCGDVSEKLKKYDKAIEYWERAIIAGGTEEEFLIKIGNAKRQK